MFFLGARAESSARHRGRDGYESDGLKGLKALGARDLNYKLCFLACAVTPTNSAVSKVCVGLYDLTQFVNVSVWRSVLERGRVDGRMGKETYEAGRIPVDRRNVQRSQFVHESDR